MSKIKSVEELQMEVMATKVHEWLGTDGGAVTFDSMACANHVRAVVTQDRQAFEEEVIEKGWNYIVKATQAENWSKKEFAEIIHSMYQDNK